MLDFYQRREVLRNPDTSHRDFPAIWIFLKKQISPQDFSVVMAIACDFLAIWIFLKKQISPQDFSVVMAIACISIYQIGE